MNPKVSVIIPVYNTEQYLSECLNSVVSQSLQEIEIIIINDASPDNSLSVIHEFQQRDNRIISIDKKKNEGVGKARNDGIERATGEFVIFMDSDDLYPSDSVLEHLYKAAKDHGVKIAGGRLQKLETDGTLTLQENPIPVGELSFLQNGLMDYADFQYDYGYQCYLIQREMLIEQGVYFPLYSRFQDPPFFVKAMYAAGRYYYIDEPVYRYRLLPISSKFSLIKTLDFLEGVMDNLSFSRENGLAKLHCLSAIRLNTEGSFMAIRNLYDADNTVLLSKLIEANQAVDVKWLKENGYALPEPFVLDVFKYAVDTAGKYEKLRNNKLIKPIRKVFGK